MITNLRIMSANLPYVCQSSKIDDETYGAVELNNQIVSGIVSVSDIVKVMIVSVNSDQIKKEKVPY